MKGFEIGPGRVCGCGASFAHEGPDAMAMGRRWSLWHRCDFRPPVGYGVSR